MFSGKRRLAAGVALVLGAGLAVAGPATVAQAQEHHTPNRIVSAYFADWDIYGRGYFVKNIPADKLNVIQYAFGVPTFDATTGTPGCNVLDTWADFQAPQAAGNSVDGVADNSADANQHLFGNFNQLRKLKAAHPGLKVEISLGGWSKSTYFADAAATPARRAAFVSACINTFIKGNLPTGGWPTQAGGDGAAAGLFDGIDVDWEYPTQLAGGNVDYGPADRHNATLLFAEFRKQLDELGKANHTHYLLTAALPAARSATNYYELASASRYLDWDNVMTYDYNVPGGTVAAPDTLFLPDPRDPNATDWTWNTVGTVAWYLRNGVPASKIVVGVPFYGNQYIRSGGLYQKFDNTGLDSNSLQWDQMPQPSYHSLVDQAGIVDVQGTTGALGYTANWDRWAGEPYLTNPAAAHTLASGTVTVPTVIVYSSPRSLRERINLVREWDLRGVMAWEISQDSDSHALAGALGSLLS
jgi:chitinase